MSAFATGIGFVAWVSACGGSSSGGAGGATASTSGASTSSSTAAGAGTSASTSASVAASSSGSGGAAAGPVAKLGASISLPGYPLGTAFNPTTKKAYFACAMKSGTFDQPAGIAVVDDTTNKIVTTISTANVVFALAVNATTGTIYAADINAGIDVIDGTTDTVTTTIAMTSPQDLAVDETHNQVYVIAGSNLLVVDGASNTVTSTYPIPLDASSAADIPNGVHRIAVDGPSQKVGIVGQDTSLANAVFTVGGKMGNIITQSSPPSFPTAVVSVGNANFAFLGQGPPSAVIGFIDPATIDLTMTPTSGAMAGSTLFVFGYATDGSPGAVSVPVTASMPVATPVAVGMGVVTAGMVIGGVVPATPGPTGPSFWLTLQPNPNMPGTGPSEAIKIGIAPH
jgi:hypothetical protein